MIQRSDDATPIADDFGPNGHPVGLDDEGNLVEWIPDEEEPGEVCPMVLRRNDKAILAMYEECRDKVWWNRHQCYRARIDDGEVTLDPARMANVAKGDEAARRIEEEYGLEELLVDDFELGLLNGKMTALAWVLGSEWEGAGDT